MPDAAASGYFSEIVYAAANEDSASELTALRLTASDEVLCITASGARPLDLLTALPKRLVSVDLNPAQTRLLVLKMAAMKALNYAEYLGFLGVTDALLPAQRGELLTSLTAKMSAEDRAFWQKRQAQVASGILYAGLWERNLRATARLAWLRRKVIDRLLNCTSLAEQREIWAGQWDNWAWRAMLRIIACRPLWLYVAKEPGIALVPKEFPIYEYMYGRLDQAAKNLLFSREPFAFLFLRGEYDAAQVLPLHLQPQVYDLIRDNLERIELVTASLIDVLQRTEQQRRFTAFSLSDFSTYCTPEAYSEVWRGILAAARPGAKVCERQFLVKLDPAATVGQTLVRDRSLEAELDLSDGGIFYTFICGRIT